MSVGERPVAAELTLDSLLRGRIRVWQPRRGAKVSLDALLLADFAARALAELRARNGRGGAAARILDLGCGGGVIALALAATAPDASLVGIELQPELAALARRNADENGAAHRFAVVEGDVRRAGELPLEAESFDLVVSNPPYHDESRPGPDASRALARHEVAASIESFVAAARRFLRPRGRLALVFPAERMPQLLVVLERASLRVRALRPVHSVAGEPARRVLVQAAREYKGGAELLPPLVVHREDRRRYTDEAARILGDP